MTLLKICSIHRPEIAFEDPVKLKELTKGIRTAMANQNAKALKEWLKTNCVKEGDIYRLKGHSITLKECMLVESSSGKNAYDYWLTGKKNNKTGASNIDTHEQLKIANRLFQYGIKKKDVPERLKVWAEALYSKKPGHPNLGDVSINHAKRPKVVNLDLAIAERDDWICPISQTRIVIPVTVGKQICDRTVLQKWFTTKNSNPFTNEDISEAELLTFVGSALSGQKKPEEKQMMNEIAETIHDICLAIDALIETENYALLWKLCQKLMPVGPRDKNEWSYLITETTEDLVFIEKILEGMSAVATAMCNDALLAQINRELPLDLQPQLGGISIRRGIGNIVHNVLSIHQKLLSEKNDRKRESLLATLQKIEGELIKIFNGEIKSVSVPPDYVIEGDIPMIEFAVKYNMKRLVTLLVGLKIDPRQKGPLYSFSAITLAYIKQDQTMIAALNASPHMTISPHTILLERDKAEVEREKIRLNLERSGVPNPGELFNQMFCVV